MQNTLSSLYQTIQAEPPSGQVASYIPMLAQVDPDQFGVFLTKVDNEGCGVGDWQVPFSIQSISKVFSLSMAYELLGDTIWQRVGVEPSGTAFNSLVQLEADRGIPRNPFINGGALVICDILISQFSNAKQELLEYIQHLADNTAINYSAAIAASEQSSGYRNIALCNFIKSFGNIVNDPAEVLDFYFHLCSIEMNCAELSKSFLYLANNGRKSAHEMRILSMSQTKRINAIMQTCGLYDESGEFTFKVGLPGKSGVGGGIIAIHPGKYSIAVWSPRLNEKGNSHKGFRFLEEFTTATQFSIF